MTDMQKTGDEQILFKGARTGFCLRDFWGWGYSDLLENTLRGTYAEFIVATALGVDTSDVRVNWEPWDLTADGIHVEVKSSSYLQTWEQAHPSDIKFSIRPAAQWSAENGFSGERRRQSDVYVFCLFAEKDAEKADPLNLDSWEFYVISAKELDKHCGDQKTIVLKSLLRLKPETVDYAGLRDAVLRSAKGFAE